MSKPVKHYGKWRIRWVDHDGLRKSASFDDFKIANQELRLREAEVEEVRRGLRSPAPLDRSFDELCDYWIANRANQKRSGHHDESIIRVYGAVALACQRERQSAPPRTREIGVRVLG